MDIQMPIMDGYESTEKIRQLENAVFGDDGLKAYIVGLTAHATDVYKNKCFESGMNEFSKYNFESSNCDYSDQANWCGPAR